MGLCYGSPSKLYSPQGRAQPNRSRSLPWLPSGYHSAPWLKSVFSSHSWHGLPVSSKLLRLTGCSRPADHPTSRFGITGALLKAGSQVTLRNVSLGGPMGPRQAASPPLLPWASGSWLSHIQSVLTVAKSHHSERKLPRDIVCLFYRSALLPRLHKYCRGPSREGWGPECGSTAWSCAEAPATSPDSDSEAKLCVPVSLPQNFRWLFSSGGLPPNSHG